jgi:molybdopterin converting factor small subunit
VAHVILMPSLARKFAGGRAEHEIEGLTIRQLIRGLEQRYPGIGERLEHGVAVAIDGEIHQNALLEAVRPDSEVCFIPAIEGG